MGSNSNIILPTLLGISFCGAAAVFVYLLMKREREKDEEVDSAGPRAATQLSDGIKPRKTLDVPIPMEAVPSIIGRGGSNIKELEQKSGARLHMLEEMVGGHRNCRLQGTPDAVCLAESLLAEALARHAEMQEATLSVPSWAVGKIIGRGGDHIRDICRKSGAKVTVQPVGTDTSERRLLVKGNTNQIKVVGELIDKCVSEEKLRREQDISRRDPRGRTNTSQGGGTQQAADRTGAMLEVFVSAVSSPSHFWVQIIGPQVQQLDELVNSMTEYYSNTENREAHKLPDVQVGQIVAAVFRYDGKWYRAKVVDIKENEYDSRQQVCDVHYVDFGDNAYIAKDELLQLRTDMLRLHFQSKECFLAGVGPAPEAATQPTSPRWHPRAIERFEQLTEACNWKRLWSHTCVFKDRSSGIPGAPPTHIPGVKLMDNKDGVDIDIGQVLIDEGWAVEAPLEEEEEKAPSPAKEEEVPVLPVIPPSFGDLECSKILGSGLNGIGDYEDRSSLPKTTPMNGDHNEDKSRPHPVHISRTDDEFKARINRVDSHHSNLDTLIKQHTSPHPA